jgi:uncharacterized protein YggU (UPF0235/DUF167 family)
LLIVKVPERAVDGAANVAVVRDVAEAFGVSPSMVELLGGAASRRKRLRIQAADVGEERRFQERLEALLGEVPYSA